MAETSVSKCIERTRWIDWWRADAFSKFGSNPATRTCILQEGRCIRQHLVACWGAMCVEEGQWSFRHYRSHLFICSIRGKTFFKRYRRFSFSIVRFNIKYRAGFVLAFRDVRFLCDSRKAKPHNRMICMSTSRNFTSCRTCWAVRFFCSFHHLKWKQPEQ